MQDEGEIDLGETRTERPGSPKKLYTETVRSEWIDRNGHMNSAYYVLAFDQSASAYLSDVGISDDYVKDHSCGVFWGDLQIRYVKEVVEGDVLTFRYQIINYDKKGLHLWQEMLHYERGFIAAECEMLVLHVDLLKRKVQNFPNEIRDCIAAKYAEYSKSPIPKGLGRKIGL